jgi:hypothetical protein
VFRRVFADDYDAEAKEPPEMTSQEWHDHRKGRQNKVYERGRYPEEYSENVDWKINVFRSHFQAVKQALSEGKPVPPEVLKDYRDLQPKEDLPRQKQSGQKQCIMGVKGAVVPHAIRLDGVDYELYRGGDAGYVRVFDADSGELVGIERYPEFKSALAKYAEKGFGHKIYHITRTLAPIAKEETGDRRFISRGIIEVSNPPTGPQDIVPALTRRVLDFSLTFHVSHPYTVYPKKRVLIISGRSESKGFLEGTDT